MIRLACDENVVGTLMEGLRRRRVSLDLVRVQDTVMSGANDPELLEWAARERRILVTHDRRTIPKFAWARVEAGRPMAGVIVVRKAGSLPSVIDAILEMDELSDTEEWTDLVMFL